MVYFLTKHFNRSLSDTERQAILSDFPKPLCDAVALPKMDDDVKEQLKSRGKDPHYGSEKCLYKLQEQVLEVVGPLTCLWADMLNKDATIKVEDTLLLIQRALVLLGSASNQLTLERRRVAWAKINPKLKSLAEGDYSKRESSLFGPGFLEKATKRVEADKALAKVTGQQAPATKRARFARDRSDLRSFLAKGAPVRYGDRNSQRHQPYTQRKFQTSKYFQKQKPSQERSRFQKPKSD